MLRFKHILPTAHSQTSSLMHKTHHNTQTHTQTQTHLEILSSCSQIHTHSLILSHTHTHTHTHTHLNNIAEQESATQGRHFFCSCSYPCEDSRAVKSSFAGVQGSSGSLE